MAKIEIVVNGKAYPCRQTMGAMLRYKKETGKEVTAMGNDLSDVCTYLYCCVASACKHDGIEFNMSLMDFADSLAPEDMMSWSANNGSAVETSDEEGEEKKS